MRPPSRLSRRDSSSTPIYAGENIYLAYGFRRALEIGAVDIVMPDLQKVGGLGEGQRIANLANLYYTPFAPHMVASYLGAMAASHVCASVPNFLILEWQIYLHRDQMYKEIVTRDGEMIVDGHIPLSNKPGIGVDIKIEAMRRYAANGVEVPSAASAAPHYSAGAAFTSTVWLITLPSRMTQTSVPETSLGAPSNCTQCIRATSLSLNS